MASAPSAVSATEPDRRIDDAQVRLAAAAMGPDSRPWTRAVLPVARQTTVSGAIPPSDARWAMSRRIPSGTTPVPDGASLPRMTRPSAPASRAQPERDERRPPVAAVDDLERHPALDERARCRAPAARSCRR